MFFKKLLIGTAAVATLGASAAVFADDYSGDDNAAATAPAVAPTATKNSGFYVTGAAGYSWAGSDNTKTLATLPGSNNPANPTIQSDSKNGGFAGRLGVGYNLDKYFGLETGFDLLSPSYRRINSVNVVNGPISISSGMDTVRTSLYAVDLLGKITLPVGRFFAFVDGGGAYVRAETQGATLNYTGQYTGSAPVSSTVTVWNNKIDKGYFRPEAGAGLGYNLTSSVAVSVSYNRIFGTGDIDNQNYLPSINTAMLGVTYKF